MISRMIEQSVTVYIYIGLLLLLAQFSKRFQIVLKGTRLNQEIIWKCFVENLK